MGVVVIGSDETEELYERLLSSTRSRVAVYICSLNPREKLAFDSGFGFKLVLSITLTLIGALPSTARKGPLPITPHFNTYIFVGDDAAIQ